MRVEISITYSILPNNPYGKVPSFKVYAANISNTSINISSIEVYISEGNFLVNSIFLDFSSYVDVEYTLYFAYENGTLKLYLEDFPSQLNHFLAKFKRNSSFLEYFYFTEDLILNEEETYDDISITNENLIDLRDTPSTYSSDKFLKSTSNGFIYSTLSETDISNALNNISNPDWNDIQNKPTTFPPEAHTHNISEITNLTTELSNKADINHNHQISDVQNLQNELDGKANIIHTHTISDVNNLQNQLDSKSDINHTHNISDINNLQLELNTKANISHIHQISDIQNLQTTLDGKANILHTHNISDVQNLQNKLDLKANLTQVIRTDINNQSLSNTEKINFLRNLDSYVQVLGMPFTNIPTNGSTITLNIRPVIPYTGRYLIHFNFVFRVIFIRNGRVRLSTQVQFQSNNLNDTKFIDNFNDYYSYGINQILSFERNFTYLHNFTNSDTITISFRNLAASNVQMIDLVDGNAIIINY